MKRIYIKPNIAIHQLSLHNPVGLDTQSPTIVPDYDSARGNVWADDQSSDDDAVWGSQW